MPQFNIPSPIDPDLLATILNRLVGNPLVTLGSATHLINAEAHDGRTLLLGALTGTICTLPTSTGGGAKYSFKVGTLATSNSHIIKVGNATDIIQGVVTVVDTDTAGTTTGFATAADSDTITLNRTTTGSVMRGEWLEIEDTAKGVFTVCGVLSNTASGATPFSATV